MGLWEYNKYTVARPWKLPYMWYNHHNEESRGCGNITTILLIISTCNKDDNHGIIINYNGDISLGQYGYNNHLK